jgi:nicotinamidase-related amidase
MANSAARIRNLTDVCVHYTFVDGHQSDYFCRVIEDRVAGSSDDAHEAALRAMEYLQSGARRSLSEVLKAMEDPTFAPA